jgi:hypothetical protein
MLTLEVIQNFSMKQRALLSVIGGIEPIDANMIAFDLETHLPRLPHQLAFQIQVIVLQKTIFRNIIDEGSLTCVMSLNCWIDIGSPSINQSPITLKSYDGRGFKPFGVLTALPVELEGNTIPVEVEVVNAPLNYNLLLGRSWIYAMSAIVSNLFHVLHSPHQGKIVMEYQLAYFNSDSRIDSVPFIEKTPSSYEDVGVGILKDSSMMGNFPLATPDIPLAVAQVNMISTDTSKSLNSYDPWVVPSPSKYDNYKNRMPLSPIEITYEAIRSTSVASYDTHDPMSDVLDEYSHSSQLIYKASPDPFDDTFHIDESILEVMSLEETPWDDSHHCSSLFLEPEMIKTHHETPVLLDIFTNSHHDVLSEGNFGNISTTIHIDILVKLGIMENIHIGAFCSPDEIQTYTSLFK